MIKKKFIQFVGMCLLGVSLVACRDKFTPGDDPIPKNDPEAEAIGKDFIPLLETNMRLSEVRSVGMDFEDPGNSEDNAKIRSPRLRFKKSNGSLLDTISADILLRREKEGKIDFIRRRGVAQFLSASSDGHSAKVRILIKKPNPKQQESPLTFERGEKWHAMLILDAEGNMLKDSDGKDIAVFGESQASINALGNGATDESVITFVGNNQTAGTGASGARRGAPSAIYKLTESPGDQEIPLISNWQELVLSDSNSDPTLNQGNNNTLVRLAKKDGFSIKPQGILLNYQITGNVYEGLDMRRAEVISNVLDFQGKYKLDPQSLKVAFEGRGGDGFGIPEWVPIKSKLKDVQQLKMYKATTENLQFGYPWDMPMVSDRFTNPHAAGGTEMTAITNEADFAMALFGGTEASVAYTNKLSGIKIGLTTPRKAPSPDAPGNYWDVVYHVQWAMPKAVIPPKEKRFTYLWIDAHSAYSQEEYFPTHATATTNNLQPSTSGKEGEYVQFIKQQSVRTQPMVVIHQTDADFTDQKGKAPRLYATLSADLMITELVYKVDGAYNFSVVELQNASRLDIALNDYALVRLVSDGNKMQYRRSSGSGTDNLDEAELFYLRELTNEYMVADYRDNNALYVADGNGTTASQIQYENTYTGEYWRPYHRFKESDGRLRLEAGQIVLIGGPGYVQDRNVSRRNWWSNFFPSTPRKDIWYGFEMRFRYFAGANTPVLNLNRPTISGGTRDGLALIKIINGKKKVIDTTAPIGTSGFGFSGTFAEYRQKLASTNSFDYYTQKRKDGVVFPFMAPYRTVKVTTDWSDDWIVATNPTPYTGINGEPTNEMQTLGHRWMASLDGANHVKNGQKVHLRLSRGSYFTKRRTPLGNPNAYNNSRPIHR